MAFKDLLQYMYSGTLPERFPNELLDMLMVADRFEVTSCVDSCSGALQYSPMSMQTALLCIDLPQPLLTNVSVQSFVDRAKVFLLQEWGDIEK